MKQAAAILPILLTLTYPLLVYAGLMYFSVQWVGVMLIALLALRLLLMQKKLTTHATTSLYPVIFLAAGCAVIATALNRVGALKLIPVIINATCLFTFASTLFRPPSMIERFARLQEPHLSPEAIIYTRQATKAWCIFFIVNGSIALYTVLFEDMKIWTLYNGLIAYILMGLMFAGEYLVRLRVKARTANHPSTSNTTSASEQ